MAPRLQKQRGIMKTLDHHDLARATGGGGTMPLSGDVRQNINTNWGGEQTNINTQIINQAPAPRPMDNTVVGYLRTHPEARLQQMQQRRAVGRW